MALLTRSFIWTDLSGHRTQCYFQRFCSLVQPHLACMRVRITPLNHSETVQIQTSFNPDVFNRRQRDYPPIKGIIPNYHFDHINSGSNEVDAWLQLKTKGSTAIELYQQARLKIIGDGKIIPLCDSAQVGQGISFAGATGETIGFDKFIAVYTTREAAAGELSALAEQTVLQASSLGYQQLFNEQHSAWEKRWENADIIIEGDPPAQQGIRFNIFQLLQANSRDDAQVSLAAKLLSHTRYKGNAFWDTEIFMFPFFLYTDPPAARKLLEYRYHMLPGARAKAKRLGMDGAMYPWMSAHDGSEQCDSWEYGDCEIHITADIAYALDQYLRVTGDTQFLLDYAAEIFIETARFWANRVAWNSTRRAYTITTVKGPDEYCAITNNNMYTNYLAAFNLKLAERAVAELQKNHPKTWSELNAQLAVDEEEVAHWHKIHTKMYQNWAKGHQLLIQDDTFLDKPPFDLAPFAERDKPVLEIIGYERAMRVRILRQTDALLLMYLLNDRFTTRQKLACFRFYEPMTTHDSSLSYNTHCIMAAELGMRKKARQYFMKTCRLDLDDELDTARSGLHGASLGGTWQSVINGFGGVRMNKETLCMDPMLPGGWQRLTYKLQVQGRSLTFDLTRNSLTLILNSGTPLNMKVWGEKYLLEEKLLVKKAKK